jgi:hypothetical protein
MILHRKTHLQSSALADVLSLEALLSLTFELFEIHAECGLYKVDYWGTYSARTSHFCSVLV